MEGIDPSKDKLRKALEEMRQAAHASTATTPIEKVSQEESERIRGERLNPKNKPPARGYKNLEERYPGAEGFARRNPND